MTAADARRPQLGGSIAGLFAAALPTLIRNLVTGPATSTADRSWFRWARPR